MSRRQAACFPRGVLAAWAAVVCAALACARGDIVQTVHHDYRVTTVADGFVHPWSIAFLPGGDMLVTERDGRLRIVRDGQLLPDPAPGVPEVLARGQGGLMEALPHPDFASNRLLYLSYSKPLAGEEGATTAVVRGTFENDRFTPTDEVFEAISRGAGQAPPPPSSIATTAASWPSTNTATSSSPWATATSRP